jgi:hypothetical protein
MQRAKEVKRLVGIAAALFGMALASGCAVFHKTPTGPAWFEQRVRQLKHEDYPQLASVPQQKPVDKPAQYWAQVESDLEGEAAALAASPRAAAPAPAATTSGAFETQARRDAETPRPER